MEVPKKTVNINFWVEPEVAELLDQLAKRDFRSRSSLLRALIHRRMLERLSAAGIPFGWVVGDSVYGDDPCLRLWLEDQDQPRVFAVTGKESVWIEWCQHCIKALLAELPEEGWQRLSAGAGSKGPRWYDWYWQPIGRVG